MTFTTAALLLLVGWIGHKFFLWVCLIICRTSPRVHALLLKKLEQRLAEEREHFATNHPATRR